VKPIEKKQESRASFDPRREVSDVRKGQPRSESKAAFDKREVDFDVMDARKVLPLRRKREGRVSRQNKLEETLEGCISGVSNADCGSFVQSAHIPCYAAAEAQAKEVQKY